jgi:geranylgeranyl diphosphate synthase type II
LFLKTAKEVCEGQQMDMDFEKRSTVSIDEYMEMIRLKTAVLLGCALQAGGILSGANQEDQEKLYLLGENIGIAFQLQDDYLDTFGDSPKVGKQIGGDILSNKKTFLYLKTKEMASLEQKNQLERLLDEKNEKTKIAETIAIYNALSIPAISQEKIDFYFQKGMSYFEGINVKKELKQPLKELIHFLYERNS